MSWLITIWLITVPQMGWAVVDTQVQLRGLTQAQCETVQITLSKMTEGSEMSYRVGKCERVTS